MDTEKLKAAGIDTDEGIARFSNRATIYEKYLYSFLKDDHYNMMLDAIEKGDVKTAFEASHALKGLAGNLSINKLYKELIPLVDIYRADTFDGSEKYLDNVKKYYEMAVEALKE